MHSETSSFRSLTAINHQMIGMSFPVIGSTRNPLVDYLTFLRSDNNMILESVDGRPDGPFCVAYKKVLNKIKIEMIERIVYERCGSVACRLWRMVKDKLKMDEKQVAKCGLIEEKVARLHLYDMLRSGLIFMQDIPKTIDHSASRTMFLWFVDPVRTMQILVQDSYKVMHRLKLRQRSENNSNLLLLEKAKRTDIVKGDAHLAPEELAAIEAVECKERKFQIQLGRMDEMIMILRDF